MLERVNVGVSTNCNAKCFTCFRTKSSKVPYNIFLKNETLLKFVEHFKLIEFIGGWGDFVTVPHGLELVQTLNDYNKKFIIETNAGIRDSEYWSNFGKLSSQNKNGAVQFSIDEIKNEYDTYRKTHTKTVLNNLKTFIDNGGIADVKTINWKFNENDIDDMADYFKSIGVRTLKRHDAFQYEESGDFSAPFFSILAKGTYQIIYTNNYLKRTPKQCHWMKQRRMMLDELGELHQCCNLVTISTLSEYQEPPDDMIYPAIYASYDDIKDIYLKNKHLINLNNPDVTFESAYNNEYNEYVRKNYKNITRCKLSCSTSLEIKDLLGPQKDYPLNDIQ
jgi:MoaA/NifB/PqqE/SkfB family radical SAM enzyme